MDQSKTPENVNILVKQFSKLCVQISWSMCIKVIENIKENYPNVPEEEFSEIALNTFEKEDINFDIKIPTVKKVKEENRCSKILQSGKNKGKNCSLSKTKGSEYCKRHLNQVLTLSTKDNPDRQSQLKKYLNTVQPKIKSKEPMPMKLRQYGDKNLYLETETNILFSKKEDGTYEASKMYDPKLGIKPLNQEKIILCGIHSWPYSQS